MTKIGCPHVEGFLKDKSATIPALVGRLELYVDEHRWKATDMYTKQALFTLICNIEKQLKKGIMKNWNSKRNEMLKTKTCDVDEIILDENN